MFNRFTERARRVLVLAQQEALKLGSHYIGTEHLLLGLVNDADSVSSKALASLNVNLTAIRSQVVERIGRDTEDKAELNYTPRAKKALELAVDEAQRLGHNYVGTEHILLGLLREGEGIAAQVLNSPAKSAPNYLAASFMSGTRFFNTRMSPLAAQSGIASVRSVT